jgi:hypothetical protein
VHLVLQNYIVGVSSFWNLAAPAIALAVLVIGFLVWGLARRPGASRTGAVIIAAGLLALVATAGVDVARNAHDVHQLETAARTRYAVTLDYADAARLFDSSNITRATVGGQTVSEYGDADVESGSRTITASLDRLADGSFVLAENDEELPVTK